MDAFQFIGNKPSWFSNNIFETPQQYNQRSAANTSAVQYAYKNNYVTPNSGSILGASTKKNYAQPPSNPTPVPTPQYNGPSPDDQYRSQMEGSINAGWDAYTAQLNDMLNTGLPGQKQAQENIANTSYNQGVKTLGNQKTQSEQAVEKQQSTSLKDLSENVSNLFQAGNVYLGARGAADSSATNQYSYAISKMGSKGRGDIMSQASDRMNSIRDIYNSEVNNLQSQLQTRIAEIADWFHNAQNQVRQSIGQAGLGRSQDLQSLATNVYNRAISAMQQLQAEASNRRATLEAWAASNSKNVQELANNMRTVQQMPAFQGIQNGMPQVTSEGQAFAPFGMGASNTNERKNLWQV